MEFVVGDALARAASSTTGRHRSGLVVAIGSVVDERHRRCGGTATGACAAIANCLRPHDPLGGRIPPRRWRCASAGRCFSTLIIVVVSLLAIFTLTRRGRAHFVCRWASPACTVDSWRRRLCAPPPSPALRWLCIAEPGLRCNGGKLCSWAHVGTALLRADPRSGLSRIRRACAAALAPATVVAAVFGCFRGLDGWACARVPRAIRWCRPRWCSTRVCRSR